MPDVHGTLSAGFWGAEQVTVTSAKNDSVTLYIDQSTYLPIKTSYSFRDPEDKQRSVEEELFDDYKPVQGIMTPRSVTRYFNGDMSAQRFVTTTTYNGEFPADIFSATVTYDPLSEEVLHRCRRRRPRSEFRAPRRRYPRRCRPPRVR